MDFVDKEHVALVEVCKKRRQIAGLFDCRTRGYADIYAELVRDNSGQSGFTQSRRAVKENVVKGFVTDFCRFDIHPEVVLGLVLTDIFVKVFRSERIITFGDVLGNFVCIHYSVFKIKFIRKMRIAHYCLPICLRVCAISCSTGSALSIVASMPETSAGE